MSFALTTAQVLDRSKTVTRRDGWRNLKAGELIQAVEKGMGLKPGEKVRRLAVLRVRSVRREPLWKINTHDCRREGFPELNPEQFVEMFCRSHIGCTPSTVVTRIEFDYVEASR